MATQNPTPAPASPTPAPAGPSPAPEEPWEDLTIRVLRSTKEKLKRLYPKKGHPTMQSMLSPIMTALANGEIRTEYVAPSVATRSV